MKNAIIYANGKNIKWQYKSKQNLLKWLSASYGDSYTVISWR